MTKSLTTNAKFHRWHAVGLQGGIQRKRADADASALSPLSYEDSNLDRQNQKLQCYHYTIRQS